MVEGGELSRHYFAKVDYGGPDPIQVLDDSVMGRTAMSFTPGWRLGIRRSEKPAMAHQAEVWAAAPAPEIQVRFRSRTPGFVLRE